MGFETLKNIIEFNKLQVEIDKQEEMYPAECPDCDWILKENAKGEKSCPMCGRTWR